MKKSQKTRKKQPNGKTLTTNRAPRRTKNASTRRRPSSPQRFAPVATAVRSENYGAASSATIAVADLIASVQVTGGTRAGTVLQMLDMNPVGFAGTHVATVAAGFEMYRWLKLEVEVITMLPTSTAGGYAAAMIADAEVGHGPEIYAGFQGTTQIMAHRGSRMSSIWNGGKTVFDCTKSRLNAYFTVDRISGGKDVSSQAHFILQLMSAASNMHGTATIGLMLRGLVRLTRPKGQMPPELPPPQPAQPEIAPGVQAKVGAVSGMIEKQDDGSDWDSLWVMWNQAPSNKIYGMVPQLGRENGFATDNGQYIVFYYGPTRQKRVMFFADASSAFAATGNCQRPPRDDSPGRALFRPIGAGAYNAIRSDEAVLLRLLEPRANTDIQLASAMQSLDFHEAEEFEVVQVAPTTSLTHP